MNVYVFPLDENKEGVGAVPPVMVTLFIPVLSVDITVKVTACVVESFYNVTVVSSAEKLVMLGDWSSDFVTEIAIVSVLLFPVVSVTASVSVSVALPNE